MISIFQALMFSFLSLMVLQIVSGMTGGLGDHKLIGLGTALYGCFVHSLVLVYFIGTGRSIKDAVTNGRLHQEFYHRSRNCYKSKGYHQPGLVVC